MAVKILPANGTFTDVDGVATIVGAQPVLADDSDATYVETPGFGQANYTVQFPPLVGYEDGDPIALHVRLSVTGGGGGPGETFLFLQTSPTDKTGASYVAQFGPAWNAPQAFTPMDGTPVYLVLPLRVRPDRTLADVLAALEVGAYLQVNTLSNFDFDTDPVARLYEAWIEVGAGEPEPEPTGKPFRRVWPREHGRVWPPPRHQHGRRTHGGYL